MRATNLITFLGKERRRLILTKPLIILLFSSPQDVIGLFGAPTTMLSDQFFYAWRGFRAAADALGSHLDHEKGASDVGLWRWSFLPPTTASERTLLTHTT